MANTATAMITSIKLKPLLFFFVIFYFSLRLKTVYGFQVYNYLLSIIA